MHLETYYKSMYEVFSVTTQILHSMDIAMKAPNWTLQKYFFDANYNKLKQNVNTQMFI